MGGRTVTATRKHASPLPVRTRVRRRRAARTAGGKALVFVVVLGALWALWEGFKLLGESLELTWPFAVNDRTDLAQAALDELIADGVDVNGESWQAQTVEVTPGGE